MFGKFYKGAGQKPPAQREGPFLGEFVVARRLCTAEGTPHSSRLEFASKLGPPNLSSYSLPGPTMGFYKTFVRPGLFLGDPEKAHERVTGLLQTLSPLLRGPLSFLYKTSDKRLAMSVHGIKFPNPAGLAAGFDKSARLTQILPALGFGFLEVGTVTPLAQPGQPKPRLFRLPQDQALINRMGFNNDGAVVVAARLKTGCSVPLGINLGKGFHTPLEHAVEDYLSLLETFQDLGDYFVLNLSSPNTPGLRELQKPSFLKDLLQTVAKQTTKPLFVKVDPDMGPKDLDNVLEVLAGLPPGRYGLIATNTTLSRPGHPHPGPLPRRERELESGGLSGKPLKARSTEVVRHLYKNSQGRWPIIGVGGIFTAQDAYEKIKAGASLVQIYTGFIYEGPGLVKAIHKGLLSLLERDGFQNLSEAVGKEI